MASEVCKCISTGRFGGKALKCYRGIEAKDFLFDDEDCMSTFLSFSEESKGEYAETYKVKSCELLTQLHVAWTVDLQFEGRYQNDYRLINNDLTVERTAWKDKYSTVLYSPGHIFCSRREMQPIPDVIRWLSCHELHYMPWQEALLLEDGPWHDIPGLFLPSKILDLFFTVIPKPPRDIALLISTLAWLTPNESSQYRDKLQKQVEQTLEADRERAKWKQHPLYMRNNKADLEKMCRKMKIPVTSSASKHQLVRMIATSRDEVHPVTSPEPSYSGRLSNVPKTITAISNLTA